MNIEELTQELMPYVKEESRVEFSKRLAYRAGRWNKEVKIHVSRQDIINIVCREMNTTFDKMIQRTRIREVAQARQLFVYIMRGCNPTVSYQSIVSIFGQDHATALHSVRTISNLYDTNKHWRNCIHRIADELQSENFNKFIAERQHLVKVA